jgi:hypothetical protein
MAIGCKCSYLPNMGVTAAYSTTLLSEDTGVAPMPLTTGQIAALVFDKFPDARLLNRNGNYQDMCEGIRGIRWLYMDEASICLYLPTHKNISAEVIDECIQIKAMSPKIRTKIWLRIMLEEHAGTALAQDSIYDYFENCFDKIRLDQPALSMDGFCVSLGFLVDAV